MPYTYLFRIFRSRLGTSMLLMQSRMTMLLTAAAALLVAVAAFFGLHTKTDSNTHSSDDGTFPDATGRGQTAQLSPVQQLWRRPERCRAERSLRRSP